MKKTILLISAIAVLASLNFAVAAANPPNGPIAELRAEFEEFKGWVESFFDVVMGRIDDVEEDLANIVLTPGPAGEDGQDGQDGQNGDDGTDGADGLNCWDLNGNGVKDLIEDINSDGFWNTLDCQGPQGEQGEPGEDGTDGAIGLSGSNLKVVDRNGDEVGYLLDTSYKNNELYFSVFNADLNLSFALSLDGIPVLEPGNVSTNALHYKTSNCSGDPYLIGNISPQSLIVWDLINTINHEYYRVNSFDDYEGKTELLSFRVYWAGCNQTYSYEPATKVYQITGPIFPGPLSIVEQ